jgi:hypothetical protein
MTWFSFANWLKRSTRQATGVPHTSRRNSRSQKLRLRLRLEQLEYCNLPSTISLVPGEPAPQLVGEPITWTATVSDEPTAGLVYQFSDGPIDGPFHMVRDFSPSNTFAWAPMEEGDYKIKVTVKQGFAATDAESAVVHDVVNTRTTDADATISKTSNPLVALYSAPPLSGDASHGELMHVEFSLDGPNPSWQSTNALPVEDGKSTNFLVAGMLPGQTYEMRDVLEDGTASAPLSFTAGSPPSNLAFPTFTASQPPGPGPDQNQDMIFHQLGSAPSNVPNPLATDLSGNLLWYYDVSQSGLTHTFPGQSLLPGGTVLVLGVDRYAASPGTLDVLREIDLAGNVVRETNVDAVNAQLTAQGFNSIFSFTHDVEGLPNGQTAVIGSTEHTINVNGTPTQYVGMTIVVLDKDFQVSWVWDAFDHLDVNRGPVLGEVLHAGDPDQVAQSTPILPAVDWLHINAVSWSPGDGNLIVSVRHQDWVLKIDYEKGAGDGHIIWRLGQGGDFTVNSTDPNPWFSHQHDAHLIDATTLILLDNGNTRRAGNPTADSRGQVWKLDESTMTATLVVNVDLGNYSPMFGAAQRLSNGDYVFTSGAQGKAPNLISQSIEVQPDGTKVYVLQASKAEFRTFRVQTLYSGISDNPPADGGGTTHSEVVENRAVPSSLIVTSTADSGAGSLRDTIAAAQSGDTIRFDPSLDGQTITLTSGELAISQSLRIKGLGADQLTISGNSTSRVFDLTGSGANVTIDGLTIANGLAAQGGGIENAADNLTLHGVTLSNDQAIGGADADAQGGGIYNGSAASLRVIDSVFANDVARGGDGVSGSNAGTAYGGALFNQGIATVNGATFGIATVNGITLGGNEAIGGDSTGVGGSGFGGGIMNDVGGTLTVRDSAFLGNQALGGRHGKLDPPPVFVEDVGNGAAIVNEATLVVRDSAFIGNQVHGGDSVAAHVAGGAGGAGAIKSSSEDTDPPASTTISDCIFLDNRSTGGAGGDHAAGGQGSCGAFLADHGVNVLHDCTFLGNESIGGVGGAGGNGGPGRAGALRLGPRDGNVSVLATDCFFAGNEALGGAAGAGGAGGLGEGGAIANVQIFALANTSTLTLRDCVLYDNEAIGGAGAVGGVARGGGISTAGGPTLSTGGISTTVIDSLVADNLALGGGGSAGNGSNGQGGGIFVDAHAALTLTGDTVADNQAIGGAGAAGFSIGKGQGGGIYIATGGSACADEATVINGNSASTSNNDIFGVLEIC